MKNSSREKSGAVVKMFPVCTKKKVNCVSAV